MGVRGWGNEVGEGAERLKSTKKKIRMGGVGLGGGGGSGAT